ERGSGGEERNHPPAVSPERPGISASTDAQSVYDDGAGLRDQERGISAVCVACVPGEALARRWRKHSTAPGMVRLLPDAGYQPAEDAAGGGTETGRQRNDRPRVDGAGAT